uniref:Death-inducer obliterator 1-like n=1 Tax=Astyanax mexicanus TaxID=7994 RepID=A0A3B1IKN5_ASTMX
MEEAGEGHQALADNTSNANEVPKRWGFRRSTIARREFMEEVGNLDSTPVSAPRRGARQARGRGRGRGRGKEAGEARPDSPAPKRGRGRGGRKSAPANLSFVPLAAPPDAPTTTNFGGSSFVGLGTTQQKTANSAANLRSSIQLQAVSDIEASSEAAVSDQTEDSDDLTLRELQERARNRRRFEEAKSEQNNDLRVQGGASSSCSDQRAGRSLDASNTDQKTVRVVVTNEMEEEAMQSEDSDKPLNDSSEESDPNAIYCICRQAHNNRFMICCDRCQEWFHGDCVGITEARGRLLEKNGEDYICPTCSPCQSPVDFLKQPVLSRAALSSSSESLLSSSAGEDRPSEDEGIRGKIRKATTPSTKRKFKIFQPEKAAAPKCIGPGCFNDALPESVYCGHQCIIRHAAVAMQTISEPKPQPQIQPKPAPKPVPKVTQHLFQHLYLFVSKLSMYSRSETKEDAPQVEPPSPPASSDVPEKEEKTEKADEKASSPDPPLRKPVCNPLPSRAKKTMPGSPRLAGIRPLQPEPSQSKKSTVTVSEKPSQNNKPTIEPQVQTPSSGPAPEIRVLPVTPAPVAPSRPLQAHPNMQMRQNIRRSLTEALSKRVSESDDLEMSESDVGRLAVNIEREMFNMYYTTDNKYKNKYRTLLLSLKDPRNKGLFYQVMKGYITPFKLTRLNQQELQGVEVQIQMPAFQSYILGILCFASFREEKASTSQARPSQPRKVSTAVSDIISSMLKDTTSEHKAHLFDLKCRICTGKKLHCSFYRECTVDHAVSLWVGTVCGTLHPHLIPKGHQSVPLTLGGSQEKEMPVLAYCYFNRFFINSLKSLVLLNSTHVFSVCFCRIARSLTPGENETGQFLSKQDTVWKGFLNMLNVAKFVTKANSLFFIFFKVKTSVTKELSLIRFHPATDEEEVAYVSLFSYFNSRRRFGVVSNICNSVKDLYLIPLSAKESIPSLLLPLEGPGLEEQHPNLILGLAICQKMKRPGAPSQEFDEKRPRLLVPLDSQGVSLPTKPTVPDVKLLDGSEPYDPDIPISTTPPGSPPAGGSPDSSSSSSSSLTGPSALSSILSVVNPLMSGSAGTAKTASSSLVPPSGAGTSSSNNPLQTILNTLFGNKKQDSDLTANTSESSPSGAKEPSVTSPTSVDPIVQQYQQTPKDTLVEKIELKLDDDDRPYDPEEEYDPEEYNLGSKVDTQLVSSTNVTTVSEIQPPVDPEMKNDMAYDPEDETLFEEMQTYLADTNTPTTSQYETAPSVTLSEQQRLLEELNRQIEEQKRQLEEQEEALRLQRAAVGVSMAHFSVSDALMSPPPCFGREPEEPTVKAPAGSTVNTSRDPRQSRNIRQDSVVDNINMDNNEVNSINESFMRKQALTQATFLEPSNNVVVHDISMPEHKLEIDTDISSITLTDKRSTSIDRKHQHQSASELDESTQSSSNEKNQHSDSRTQRHSSKPENNSSPRRRSRQNDRRSHHEEKSSRVSRGEADRYRRRGKRSPERSRRSRSRSRSRDRDRSRSRSRRQERVSSSQRDRHRHRSTSRHRTRRDQRSPRLHSTQSRRSEQREDDKSRQKEQSPSRPRRRSIDHSTELAQSTKQEASMQVQGDELPNKASENGEQNASEVHQGTENNQPSHRRQPSTDLSGLHDKVSQREQLPLMTNLYQGDVSQPGSEKFGTENKPALESAKEEHSNKDFKVRDENRDEPEVPKDHFSQRDHSELPSQRNRNTGLIRQADLLLPEPQSFQSEGAPQRDPRQSSENSPHTSRENSLQRDDFWQDDSERFHRRGQPRFERSLLHQSEADQFPSIRDLRGNVPHDEPVFSGQRDEKQSFGSLHSQRGHSSYHEIDHKRQFPQRIPQTHREDSTEREQPFSKNESLSGPPDLQRRQPPQRVLQTHREGSLEHERPYFRNQTALSGPPDMASGGPDLRFNREALAVRPSQGHRGNLAPDETHQNNHDNYPERIPPSYGEERETNKVSHNADRYSGNFPLQETESGHQRGLPYRPAHLQEGNFVQPEAEETDFKNHPHQMPSSRRRGSFHEDDAEQLHHQDHAPADFSQRERDIPRELYFREQFRPRAPGDQWRGPPPRVHGPRGPPLGTLMTPRGPIAIRPRMPRAPHPERFENSAPGPNFGPRGPYLRPRMVGDAGTSPNFGPRGPPSRPETFEGAEPSINKNIRPRGPSPVSHMFEAESPQNPVFRSRFQGPGMSEGHRPRMLRPRGPSFGPRMFEGPRPGPLRFRNVMGGPRGLCQPRHEVPRGPIDVGGPPHPQFDNGNPELPNLNNPKDFHGTSDFDPDQPFDEAQPQGSDESNFHNSANESFSNPQEQRYPLGRWTQGQPRIPMSRSHSCNLPETPQFPDVGSDIKGPQRFDEVGEQGTLEEIDEPHFEEPDVYKGSMDCEDDTQTKVPRFNLPRDFSRQRAPSPHFSGLRMPAPRNKESFEDTKPYSPRFLNAPTFTQLQRPPGPKGNEIPGLLPRTRLQMVRPLIVRPQMVRPQMVRPQMVRPEVVQPQTQLVGGPSKEPDVRPLRLSGPLLPTPPGGPIRMQNPRMQRPQGPPARGPNTGINPPRFDDKFNNPQRQSSQTLIHEGPAEEHEGEESSSQDSSPVKHGKRWRRRPRKREGRNKAARKQRIKERRKSGGEG